MDVIIGKRSSGKSHAITEKIGDGKDVIIVVATPDDYKYHTEASPLATVIMEQNFKLVYDNVSTPFPHVISVNCPSAVPKAEIGSITLLSDYPHDKSLQAIAKN